MKSIDFWRRRRDYGENWQKFDVFGSRGVAKTGIAPHIPLMAMGPVWKAFARGKAPTLNFSRWKTPGD